MRTHREHDDDKEDDLGCSEVTPMLLHHTVLNGGLAHAAQQDEVVGREDDEDGQGEG